MDTLLYADDDAISIYRLFQQSGIICTLLVDMDEQTHKMNPQLTPAGKPTLRNLFAAFDTIVDQMRRDAHQESEFYFYYSGHGKVEKGQGLLILTDACTGTICSNACYPARLLSATT